MLIISFSHGPLEEEEEEEEEERHCTKDTTQRRSYHQLFEVLKHVVKWSTRNVLKKVHDSGILITRRK